MNDSGGQRGLVASLVRRPVMLSTLFTTAVVLSLIAYARIPIQMLPDGIIEPGMQVSVAHQGASAVENEQKIARVLEEELRSLPSLVDVSSISRADSVSIFVEFESSVDMNFAKAEVRDRVERARPKLPTTVDEVSLFSWNESDLPIQYFALLHPGDSPRTDFLVENVIQRRVESVDGVGKCETWGLLDDSLRILLDEDLVRGASLDLGGLIRRLRADNFSQSFGEFEDGGARALLRADMRFRSPAELEDYPIGDGLRVRDIGRVEMVKSVRESLFRIDGQYAYFFEVRKDGQANIVETCRRVTRELASLEQDPQLAGQFHFIPVFDQGRIIEDALGQLLDSAWEGGLLAIAILFVFLWRVRQTLLVALSIPISVLLALAWCYFTGRTFNILTMTGITLALGMLVDNAIVVLENITRLQRLGFPVRESVVRGTSEVALAVVLSTLTTVAVFVPLIFMNEDPVVQLLFGELGLPLCASVLISLVVALVFMPVAAGLTLGPRPAWLTRLVLRLGWITRLWEALVAGTARLVLAGGRRTWTLVRGAVRLGLALVVSLRWVLTLALVGLLAWRVVEARELWALSGSAAVGESVSGALFGWLASAGLLTVASLAALHWRLPRALAALALPRTPSALARPGGSLIGLLIAVNHALLEWSLRRRLAASLLALLCVGSVVVPISQSLLGGSGSDGGRTQLRVSVQLEDNFTLAEASDEMLVYERFLSEKKAQYGFARSGVRITRLSGSLRLFWDVAQTKEHFRSVRDDLKQHLPRIPGHTLNFLDEEDQANSRERSLVSFTLAGSDSTELARLGQQAVEILESLPGITSVRSPLESAPPQVNLSFDSDLGQRLGVTAQNAFENIAWALRGSQLPRFQDRGREVPLIIEYDDTVSAGLDTLRELEIFTGSSSVPLAAVARLEFGTGSRSVWRTNGQTTFTIQARIDNPAQQGQVAEQGKLALAALELPRGYAWSEDDSVLQRQFEELLAVLKALLLALILVYLIMGILFESFVLPFSVLMTIPYAVVGGLWSIYLTGTPIDPLVIIGLIILIGVVVNNGIVLVDHIQRLRSEGLERTQAVLDGTRDRLRPVLMTALTSVLGLWPMAITEPPGDGIDFRALATCVGGGLVISTLFTLSVVPLFYTLFEDLGLQVARAASWSRGLFRRRRAEAAAEAAAEPSA